MCHGHVTARFGLACASRDMAEGRTRLCVPVRCRSRSRCRLPGCGEPRHRQDCPELRRENNSKEIFTRQLLAGACCGESRSRCCTQPSMKNSSREGLRGRERELLRLPGFYCAGETKKFISCPQTLGTGGFKLAGESECVWMDGRSWGCEEAMEPLAHGCSVPAELPRHVPPSPFTHLYERAFDPTRLCCPVEGREA